MKTFALLVVLNIVSLLWSKFTSIHTSNQLRERAIELYQVNDFQQASKALELLVYTHKQEDDVLKINLALCYEKLHRYSESKALFQKLSTSPELAIRSQALLHLGVMISGAKKELALNYFKQALKADPSNEQARYNYELLKKLSPVPFPESQKKESDSGKNSQLMSEQEQDRPNESSNNAPASQNKEEGTESQLNDNGKDMGDALASERLSNVHLSERQARFILESLKNNEVQYVQQLKKSNKNSNAYKGPDY